MVLTASIKLRETKGRGVDQMWVQFPPRLTKVKQADVAQLARAADL